METLFSTDVIINGENESFDVVFENDAYVFQPTGNATPFSVRRADDEWKVAGSLNNIAQQQAISALERYLLSQH